MASLSNLFSRLRRSVKVTTRRMRTKPTIPQRAKTKPERGLFWRKDSCVVAIWVLAADELEPVADSSAVLTNAVTVCLTPSEVVSYTDSETEGNEEAIDSELLLLNATEDVSEVDTDDVELEDDDDLVDEESLKEDELEVSEALETELVPDADVDEVRITLETPLAAELTASPMSPITLVALDTIPLRTCLCARFCPSIQVEIGEESKECGLEVAEDLDIPKYEDVTSENLS